MIGKRTNNREFARIECDPDVADVLECHGLSEAAELVATESGQVLRRLGHRENWRLELAGTDGRSSVFYLKKHWQRSWGSRARAWLRLPPPRTPAWTEAERCRELAAAGIPAMTVAAVAEQRHADGTVASAFLTPELVGCRQLDLFLTERFDAADDPALKALVEDCGQLAGRFHRAGFNHRDFYSCHVFIREDRDGAERFAVYLIDLQRVQRWPTLLRRRWIVKDLGQLAYSTPWGLISRTHGMRFFKGYLQKGRLSPRDKRLVRAALRRAAALRYKHGPYRREWEADIVHTQLNNGDRISGIGDRAA